MMVNRNSAASIVIPVYNGAETVEKLVEKLISLLGAKVSQIILINDGSADNSLEVCIRLAKKFSPIVTCIDLCKNFGEHNAVMAGLNHSNGDYTVIIDDDFQNPPEEVIRLIEEASSKNLDAVYTYSDKRQHSFLRNMGSDFNHWVANFMIDKPRHLYLSSFKCINRLIVKEITKYKGPFPYIDGLIFRCTGNVGTIKVEHEKRNAGRSGYTTKKLVNLWLNMFINFSVTPLRISTFIGIILSSLGALFSIVAVLEKLFRPDIPLGWTSLVIAVLLFSGIQLLTLGLIGEYLGRLFLSSNSTPPYVIRNIYGNDSVNE